MAVEPLGRRTLLSIDLSSIPQQIVDTQDAAYTQTGDNWQAYSDTNAYQGSISYHVGGNGTDGATAQFAFSGLDPTQSYQVFVTWTAGTNRATDSPFTVLNGTTPLRSVLINQQFAPNNATGDGTSWESLGAYQPTSGALNVQLGDAADGYVIANAVCVVQLPAVTTPPSIIDNGDAAYTETGSGWLGWSDAAAYGGDFRYHTPGSGTDAAIYTFAGVDPNQAYQVYATWTPDSNRATNAPFSVYDSDTLLGTKLLNQQDAPADASMDGTGWESLGVYTATSGALVVTLGDNADGDVIANAIQIVPVAPVATAPERGGHRRRRLRRVRQWLAGLDRRGGLRRPIPLPHPR